MNSDCKKKSNIILVGMPSCGKSTVGVILAKTMNKDFVDTDILIQQRELRPLQQIINEDGNDRFHEIEEEVLMSYDGENTVIATGGSAIYFENAIEKFKENGTVIYIKVSLETVLKRLNNISTRGVTLEKGQTLEDLYHARVPLYESRCEKIVEADELDIEGVVTEIVKIING